ncbi:Dihydrofolate synthase @ Folylpolyglutamate synthase [hydrothermal vent metagenome]|uniref:Dihydrofolate synthase @ Folylpolyglutamate synthase n=1 Tax=hydrothermal vent metagenome TaxID=652676 RepID=A0A1W1C9R5_9ZZZZ
MILSFNKYLDEKPLYFDEIDYKRVHLAYATLEPHIKHPKIVHIVGTNGKGSTGRIIAHLAKYNIQVGHFSSPHIQKFNERIWINGFDIDDNNLNLAHKRLYSILGDEVSDSLSYFEYTTLLAFVAFENVDLIVLEAGLGGEFDATNVCNKFLTVITPIGIDHQAFLGETIEEIASTKIRSIQDRVLVAKQSYLEVNQIAKDIAKDKNTEIYFIPNNNPIDKKLNEIIEKKQWSDYIIDNTLVAIEALNILDIKYDINNLIDLELFGRFYKFRDNIIIDVGHNPLASRAIYNALDKKVVLIYNSLEDKDYKEVLKILKPKLKRVEIIKIPSQRAVTIKRVEEALNTLDIKYSFFNGDIKKDEDYLVFGSFYVIEEFLTLY